MADTTKIEHTGKPVASIAAKLLAMNDEDFYNWLMGGTNATGAKRLAQLRSVLASAVTQAPDRA